jgi:hypothetical protein
MDDNRRADINKMIPAELEIREARIKVEALGAHVRLTDASYHLSEAQSAVADWAEATGNIKPE